MRKRRFLSHKKFIFEKKNEFRNPIDREFPHLILSINFHIRIVIQSIVTKRV